MNITLTNQDKNLDGGDSANALPKSIHRARFRLADADSILFLSERPCPDAASDLFSVAALLSCLRAQSSSGSEVGLSVCWAHQARREASRLNEDSVVITDENYAKAKRLLIVGSGGLGRDELSHFFLNLSLSGKQVVGIVDSSASAWGEALPMFGLAAADFEIFPKGKSSQVGEQLRHQLSAYADDNARLLLQAGSEANDSAMTAELATRLNKALFVVTSCSGIPSLYRKGQLSIDALVAVKQIIEELSLSAKSSATIDALNKQYDLGRQAVAPLVEVMTELRPGIWVRLAVARVEQERLVEALIADEFNGNAKYKVVLEFSIDRPASGLPREKALELEERLQRGESEHQLFDEMQEILKQNKDMAHVAMNELYLGRERGLSQIIQNEIALAKYAPDPKGRYTLVKAEDKEKIFLACERNAIPLLTQGIPYALDLQGGVSRPLVLVIGGSQIERFLDAVVAMG